LEQLLLLTGRNCRKDIIGLNEIFFFIRLVFGFLLLSFWWSEAAYEWYWVLFFGGVLIPSGVEIWHNLVWFLNTSLNIVSFITMLFIPNLAILFVFLMLYLREDSTLINSIWILVGFLISFITIDWSVLAFRPLKFYSIPESMVALMA